MSNEMTQSAAYRVTAYQRANVRELPRTTAVIRSYVAAGQSYPANGWVRGEKITDNGITNDIWIELPLNAGGKGYVSAVYLKGNERADLPVDAKIFLSATGSHEQRIEQAVSYFRKQGWSREQAIGIVANLDAESGMDPNIQQHGGGPGYGLAQWEGPRQLDFQHWAGRPIHGSSFEQQLQFVQYELTHTESSAGAALRRARTVEEAAVIVTRQYERPADTAGEAVRRSKRAKEIEG